MLQRTQEDKRVILLQDRTPLGKNAKKEERNRETSLKKLWGELPQNLFAPQNGPAPETPERLHTLRNLGGTAVKRSTELFKTEPFGSLGQTCPKEPEAPRNLAKKPWWELLQDPLVAQDGSAPENKKTPRNLLAKSLSEPSAEFFGSPRQPARENKINNETW